MPYKLTWEDSGVHRRYFGDVTVAERRASFDAVCGDARFDNLRYSITDYRDVRGYEVTPEATAEIAALHLAPMNTNSRIIMAAIATRADIVDAIQDFIAHRFTSAPYRIFADEVSARSWIQEHRRLAQAAWRPQLQEC